jgi:chromosome segregation ATPase
MTPVAIPVLDEYQSTQSSVVLSDVMNRLGTLEEQVREILPAISRVAEGMSNIACSVGEVKGEVKELTKSFSDYKVDKVDIENRLTLLEDKSKSKDKEASDQKGRLISIAGGALASFIVAALIYFLKLR